MWTAVVSASGRGDVELPLGRGLALGHPLTEVEQLRPIEDLARLGEHLAFLFLDVVLDVLLHDHRLGAPLSSVTSSGSSSLISRSTTWCSW